ncbi:hypothetical protein [Legionella brunensis]|uniref:Purine NTPase n=1 Tax=Legionella brunensis TaxID=29422 RepID=A0A0W0SND3_9GAMM|nr:hypothetical protein [Legionella brunensis]KTC84820.1 purine NTPase [Legionella brunensis]
MPSQLELQREEQFRQLFAAWRQEKASNEENYLKTAIAISRYTDNLSSIETIKRDLETCESQLYIDFDQYGGKRTLGTLLYGRLATQEYLNSLADKDSPEAQLLSTLTQTLSSLYSEPLSDLSSNLNLLLNSTNLWLNSYAIRDPEKGQTLCRYLYTTLRIAKLRLDNNISWAHQKIAATQGIDLAEKKQQITNLLEKTEKTAKELEALLHSHEEPSAPKNLVDYFNKEFLVLLAETPEPDKLATLEGKLNTVHDDTLQLLKARQRKAEIESEIKPIQRLVQAVITNDQKIIDRLYFVDLIKQYQTGYDLLVVTENGKRLAQKADSLINPDTWQQFSSTIQYSFSWLTALPTIAYRSYFSQDTQDTVASYFVTLDSECKNDLKILAQTHLKQLEQDLSLAGEEVEKAGLVLAKEQLKPLIAKTTDEELINLVETTETIKNVIEEYKVLLTIVTDKREKLKNIKNLSAEINEFIKIHDDFFVMISNFLSNLSPVFKTEKAKMVDEIHLFKEKLHELAENYQLALSIVREDFSKAPNADSIRQTLAQTIILNSKNVPVAPVTGKLKAPAAFFQIKTTFSQIKTTPPPPSESRDEPAVKFVN